MLSFSLAPAGGSFGEWDGGGKYKQKKEGKFGLAAIKRQAMPSGGSGLQTGLNRPSSGVDESLMARRLPSENQDKAAAMLRRDVSRKRNQPEEDEDDGGEEEEGLAEAEDEENEEEENEEEEDQEKTLKQGQAKARLAEEAKRIKSAGDENRLVVITSNVLKQAWLNILDSFGLTLIYINAHVFGRSIFGEKVFCALGEEWIPKNARSSLNSEAVKKMVAKIKVIEKIVLVFLDLILLFAFIFLSVAFIMIIDFMSKSWAGKAGTLLNLGWDGIKALVDLF